MRWKEEQYYMKHKYPVEQAAQRIVPILYDALENDALSPGAMYQVHMEQVEPELFGDDERQYSFTIYVYITSTDKYIKRTGTYGVRVRFNSNGSVHFLPAIDEEKYIQPGRMSEDTFTEVVTLMFLRTYPEMRSRFLLLPKVEDLAQAATELEQVMGLVELSEAVNKEEKVIGSAVYADMDENTVSQWRQWVDDQTRRYT